MLINLGNQLTQAQGIQQTYVASNISAGGTSSPVKNVNGFNGTWAQQFGQTGEETAEIMLVSGIPSGTVLNFGTSPSHTAGTLLYAHALDTPIYQIHYDQVIVYRSTAGTSGPFSSLATINIQPDNLYTQYDDTSGAAGYAYYAQYYNSVNGDLSGSSSVFIPGGPTYYSLQKMRQRIKDKLYSSGYIRDDSVITDWINEFYEDMVNAAVKVNQGYMLGTQLIAFGTSGFGTITDTSFIRPVKVEVTYQTPNDYARSREIALYDFVENDFFDTSAPRHTWTGETTFEILPHQQAGTARITYAVRFTPLVNDTDEFTQTLKPYTKACTEYVLGVAYGLDQKDADSQQHNQLYLQGKADFIAQVTPRDLSGAKMISIEESVSGLADDIAQDLTNMIW